MRCQSFHSFWNNYFCQIFISLKCIISSGSQGFRIINLFQRITSSKCPVSITFQSIRKYQFFYTGTSIEGIFSNRCYMLRNLYLANSAAALKRGISDCLQAVRKCNFLQIRCTMECMRCQSFHTFRNSYFCQIFVFFKYIISSTFQR